MTKITKKSINTLMDIYKSKEESVVLKLSDPNNNDTPVMEITIKTDLSIPDKGLFVDRVVNACFDVDGDFLPQYLDPVFAITLLQMTTNVPMFEMEITPTLKSGEEASTTVKVLDIEKTYQLCKAINLLENVADDKYRALVADLKGMVVAKLEYMKQVNSKRASSIFRVIQPILESFQKALSNKDQMDSLKDVLIKANEEMGKLIQPPKEN